MVITMDKKKIFKGILFVVYILLLVFFIESGNAYGIIGMVAILLLVYGYSMYVNRESLKLSMGYIESMIFGKPLEKDYWEKGELKNLKIKFVRKKKNENQDKT
jgi:hypothetical protein